MAERVTERDAIAAVEQHRAQLDTVIGGLEGQIHGMDQRLNNVDARLEALLLEQQALAAVVRESLQQMGRPPTNDSEQTQSDLRREQGTPSSGSTGGRPVKMDCPRFSGDDPLNWVFRAEQYFDCQGIAGDERVRHATVYFEGAAVRWFRWLVSQQGRPDWATFVRELTTRFGPCPCPMNPNFTRQDKRGEIGDYRKETMEATKKRETAENTEYTSRAWISGLGMISGKQMKEEGAAQTETSWQEQKKEAARGAALHLRPLTSGSPPLLQKAAGENERDSHTALLKRHTQEVGRLEKRESARDERNWSSVEATEKDYSRDGRWHEEKIAFPLKTRKNLEWAFDSGEDDSDNGSEDEGDDDDCKQKRKKAKAVEKKWRCSRTKSAAREAHLYDWQLQRAKRTGRIVFPTIAFVMWDPHGALIGSGATTLNALRAFTCRLTPPRVKMRVQLLPALGNTGIDVMVGIPNDMLSTMARSTSAAEEWVSKNVTASVSKNGVSVKYVAIGNEPCLLTLKGTFIGVTFPALQNVQNALVKAGLANRVKVTVPFNAAVYQSSTQYPSGGDFRSDIRNLMLSIVKFLSDNGSPITVNIYPFISLYSDPNFPVDFAFFDGTAQPLDDNGRMYSNVFDANHDTLIWALQKNGFGNMSVIIGEIGWPTDGDKNANPQYAQRFNEGFMKHISQEQGTPMRSGPVDAYLFSLIDEEEKGIQPGDFERHWGIFNYDGTAKYVLNLGQGISTQLIPAKGVKYMAKKWCVFKPGANLADSHVADSVSYACALSDCTSLGYDTSCNNLDSRGYMGAPVSGVNRRPSRKMKIQTIVEYGRSGAEYCLIHWKGCRLDSSLLIPYYTVASGAHKEPCRLKADDIVQKFPDFTP